MKIQSFINQKGGVGKTTLAYHAAHAAAEAGERVCVIDLDSQANITSMLRRNYSVHGSAKVFPDITFADALYAEGEPDLSKGIMTESGIYVLPAHRAMDVHDSVDVLNCVTRAKSRLETLVADRVIIDCGPTMGLRQALSVALADQIFVPLEANSLSISGVGGLQKLIEGVSLAFQKDRQIHYIINKVNKRSKLHKDAIHALQSRLAVLGVIHESASLSRVPHATRPVWVLPTTPSTTRKEWRDFYAQLLAL